jgi:putative DNA primase/helicase
MTIDGQSLVVPTPIQPVNGGAVGGASSSAGSATGEGILRTHNEVLGAAEAELLDSIDLASPPSPLDVERRLIALTNVVLGQENLKREPRERFAMLKHLAFSQLAKILLVLHSVVAISPDGSGRKSPKDLIAVYDPDRGVYKTGPDEVREVARRYNRELTVNGARELITVLREWAPRVRENSEPDWIPLANGDFNFGTKELHPFSRHRVFLNRIPTSYNERASLVSIRNAKDGTYWDIVSWIRELACGSPELEVLLWQVLAASVRAKHPWNKGVGFFSPYGNNGKGTLLDLTRELVGHGNNLSASLLELSLPATQEAITGKSLITGDENNVNAFLKFSDVVKKLVTGDPLFVNPKYEKPYNYAFAGFMIQCLNELPKSGDKTQSFWRRWLLIPFNANFEGCERKYIKTDYIRRPEVLEYVLKCVLEMDFDEFAETDETRQLLAEAKLHNDPARLFWDEHKDQFVWTLLPLAFLYDLYKAWFDDVKPSGRKVDRTSFYESLRAAVGECDDGWEDHGKGGKRKAAQHMSHKEPLAKYFDLDGKWQGTMNPSTVFSNVIYHSRAAERAAERARQQAAAVLEARTVTPEEAADAEALRQLELDRRAKVTFDSQRAQESSRQRIEQLKGAGFYDLPEGARGAIVDAFHVKESGL